MNFLQRYVDNQIKALGYVKANEANIIYQGETIPGEEGNPWANWELQHFQILAMANPYFFSGVKLIADSVALGEFLVQEKISDKWEDIPDHPLSSILDNRPNPYHSQFSSWWYQTTWMYLQGEAYWMVTDSPISDDIAEIYRLPAGRIKPMPDSQKLYSGFAYTPRSGQTPDILEPTQVIYHMFPNPFEYRRGYSPLLAYLAMLKLAYEADKFDIEDYQNGLSLRHLISLRPELSTRDKFKFEEDMRTAQRSGLRWWVARGGDVKVDAIASRRDDKAGAETVNTRSEQIANLVLGIPDGLRARNATEANATIAEKLFINQTIWPLMTMLAEDITTQQIVWRYGDNFRVVPKDIRPENIDQKLKQVESLRKVQTLDEARGADGLEAHADPDVGGAPFEIAGQVYLEKMRQLGGGAGGDIPAISADGEPLEANPKLALNGAQVTAALSIVESVSSGLISREAGINTLEIMFNLDTEQANRILVDEGKALEFAIDNYRNGKATAEQMEEFLNGHS